MSEVNANMAGPQGVTCPECGYRSDTDLLGHSCVNSLSRRCFVTEARLREISERISALTARLDAALGGEDGK